MSNKSKNQSLKIRIKKVIILLLRCGLESWQIIRFGVLKIYSIIALKFSNNKAQTAENIIKLGNIVFRDIFDYSIYKDYDTYIKSYNNTFAGFDRICDIENNVSGKRVIEIGSGLGHYSNALSLNNAKQVLGVEIQKVKANFANKTFGNGEKISFIQGDATKLDIKDNTFDFAFSHTVFEHISNVPKALSEVKRVLTDDGKFLLSFNYIHHTGGHHLFPYINFPWANWLVPEEYLCKFWTEKLKSDQDKGKIDYYEQGASLTHLGHGSEFNLNRIKFDEFENMVGEAGFKIEKRLSSEALGLIFPFLRKIPKIKYPLTGTVFYMLSKK